MELNPEGRKLRLRLNSCLETVLEVQRTLTNSGLEFELPVRLRELKKMLRHQDVLAVAEHDVAQMETATNHLMEALKPLLESNGAELELSEILN